MRALPPGGRSPPEGAPPPRGRARGPAGRRWALPLLVGALLLGVLGLSALLGLGGTGAGSAGTPPGDVSPRPAAEVAEPLTLRGSPGPAVPEPSAPPASPTATPAAPPAPREVAFVVREEGGGQPVSGATLRAVWSVQVAEGRVDRAGDLSVVSASSRWAEATLDAHGRCRLEVPAGGADLPHQVVVGDSWRVLSRLAAGPGRLEVVVRRAYWLAGVVLDPDGAPVAQAALEHTVVSLGEGLRFQTGLQVSWSDAEGRFRAGPFDEDPQADAERFPAFLIAGRDRLLVRVPGWAPVRLVPSRVAAGERERQRVVLSRGLTLAGTLTDAAGQPLPDVPVVVEYGDDHELRRGARTDAQGRWRLERLSPGDARLLARAFERGAKVARDLVLAQDDLDVRLVAEEIRLARAPDLTRVLDLALCDVTDELRAAYDVPEHVHVLILEAGPGSERLGIGRIEPGSGLWHVGETAVGSVREALERLLASPAAADGSLPERRRVVTTLWNERLRGTNTQHLRLSAEDRAALRQALERLAR